MIDLTTDPDIGYGRDRTKKARWKGDTDADGKTFVVEMSVSHNRDRKAFSCYVTRLLESKTDTGFTVSEYQPFRDIVRLGNVPCARYSDKALDETFTVALHTLQIDNATAPEVEAILTRADD